MGGSRLALGWLACLFTVMMIAGVPRLTVAAPLDLSKVVREEKGRTPSTYLLRFYQKYISDLRYGRCRFDPSCSQFGVDAIEEYGFLEGSCLTADRLIRCNEHAEEFHAVSSDGRISDPPDGAGRLPDAPRVPDWLLPDSTGASYPPSAHGSAPGDSPLGESARVIEAAAFADALALAGDCERAVTEYKRVAFLANTGDAAEWSFFKIGDCYFRNSEWKLSATAYLGAAQNASSSSGKMTGLYMTATAHFNDGEYGKAVQALDSCPATEGAVSLSDVHALRGLSTLALGEWMGSAESFTSAADASSDEAFRERALFLAQNSERGTALPSKHANLAAGFSAVLPGSGQMYAGRWYDGFRHLVVNGLLIFTVYQLADDDLWGAAYLTAGITLPFYVGNIMGAKRSAERYNASKRTDFVSGLLRETAPHMTR